MSCDSIDIADISESDGSCASCIRLKKKIASLQKTLSWYKITKAHLKKKLLRREAENKDQVVDVRPTKLNDSDSDLESQEECFDKNDYASSMDYSSLEESSHSAVEMDQPVTRNTVW
jgi:hypothetical protein